MYEITYLNLKENEAYEKIVENVLYKCFEEEGLLDSKLMITVTFTTPEEIKKINIKYRNIDKATDVLSFPMFEKEELDRKIENKDFLFEDMLGDIIISIEKVKEQAEEYGHSFERELAYLTTHSCLHILGYDHMNDEDKKEMRTEEEFILGNLGYVREDAPYNE